VIRLSSPMLHRLLNKQHTRIVGTIKLTRMTVRKSKWLSSHGNAIINRYRHYIYGLLIVKVGNEVPKTPHHYVSIDIVHFAIG